MKKDTFFAPAERSSEEKILDEHKTVLESLFVRSVMDAINSLSVILDENRQIIFANQGLIDFMGIKDMSEALGLRPGEALSCINANGPGGCGTSKNCRMCGAVNTILRSMDSQKPAFSECLIASTANNHFEFKAYCAPLVLHGHTFIVMTLTDLSEQKRKQLLEHFFLNDLANQTNNLQGLSYLIKESGDPEESFELTRNLCLISDTISDVTRSYRELVSAENGKLSTEITQTTAQDMVGAAVLSACYLDIAKGKSVIADRAPSGVTFQTDPMLLQRVLLNMLKNALEAIPEGEIVRIGHTAPEQGRISFYVQNPGVISDQAQALIFHRSFSTKGQGRGLGTYSMKLMGERYLKGAVGFESNEEVQTRFFITLPLEFPKE